LEGEGGERGLKVKGFLVFQLGYQAVAGIGVERVLDCEPPSDKGNEGGMRGGNLFLNISFIILKLFPLAINTLYCLFSSVGVKN
jgi:hypothetical protein